MIESCSGELFHQGERGLSLMPLLALSLSSASDHQGLRILLLVLLIGAVVLLIVGGIIAVWTLHSYRKATAAGHYGLSGEGEGQAARF
jgi:ABC-type transport system involved in cytochrome c biogenesis permease component